MRSGPRYSAIGRREANDSLISSLTPDSAPRATNVGPSTTASTPTSRPSRHFAPPIPAWVAATSTPSCSRTCGCRSGRDFSVAARSRLPPLPRSRRWRGGWLTTAAVTRKPGSTSRERRGSPRQAVRLISLAMSPPRGRTWSCSSATRGEPWRPQATLEHVWLPLLPIHGSWRVSTRWRREVTPCRETPEPRAGGTCRPRQLSRRATNTRPNGWRRLMKRLSQANWHRASDMSVTLPRRFILRSASSRCANTNVPAAVRLLI